MKARCGMIPIKETNYEPTVSTIKSQYMAGVNEPEKHLNLWYLGVFLFLVLQVILYYLITIHFE